METYTLVLVNIIINLTVVIDHFINRCKRSSCMGNTIEMNDNVNNKDIVLNNIDQLDNDNIIKLKQRLEELYNERYKIK